MSTFKLASLGIRTLAKPIANRIKAQAREHPRFRHICINFAQRLHRIDMRWRIGLLQDPAVIDRQVKREQAEAEAKRNPQGAPTVKTEGETDAEKKEAEEIKKKLKKGRPIKPLSEAKAIDFGASFISESFLFLVAVGLLFGERWWSSRKARERRDELDERLEALVAEVEALKKPVAGGDGELVVKAQSTENTGKGESRFNQKVGSVRSGDNNEGEAVADQSRGDERKRVDDDDRRDDFPRVASPPSGVNEQR